MLLLVATCAASDPPLALPAPAKVAYLVSHGWHVGITVKREDVSIAIWPESADLGSLRHVEVGWGDGGFYPAPRGTVALALKAAFSSESSVLHVAAFDPPVREFFAESTIVEIALSPGGFEALSRFIHDSYARDADGRPTVVAPGLYGHARFYRATGRYRLFDNSNNWTARALQAAGCRIDPAEAITAGTVLEQARKC